MIEETKEEINNILDFENALKVLDEASETFQINVWIPSKNQFLKFKEIDAKQQKDLLNAAMDNSIYNSSFLKVFTEIINSNLLEEEKSILEDIVAADKASIAIALKNQISEDIKVIFDEKNNIIEKINIKPIIEKFKNFKTKISSFVLLENESVQIKAEICQPNLKKELEYSENLNKQYKKADQIKTNEEVQTIISDAFIGETSKYIKNIWINNQEVCFDNITINQKNAIVEKLPSALMQKILEQVSDWKKELDNVLTVTKTLNNKEYTKVIAIDSLLFLS
jgi:hypothetical protein